MSDQVSFPIFSFIRVFLNKPELIKNSGQNFGEPS